jgi:hypothetical protein
MFLKGATYEPDWAALARFRARLPGVLAEVAAHPARVLLLVFGRFLMIRRAVAAVAATLAPAADARARSAGEISTDLEPRTAVATLRRNGLCAGLALPLSLVNEMRAYAESHIGYAGPGWRTRVPPGGLAEAEQRTGRKILVANLPFADLECSAVRRVVEDGWMRAVALGYLGASARVIDVRLFWSFPARGASHADMSRVAQDTFHFDLGDWGQLKFFFYLTDVDSETGAHVYVLGSHRRRRLSHQFTPFSAKTDGQIAAAYGPESIASIVGPAGFGFVEDPFGFHMGSAVRRDRRLVLEVTFGIVAPLRDAASVAAAAAAAGG